MNLELYYTLAEVAQKLGISKEAARLRLKRRQIPTTPVLGQAMVLKVSLEEDSKRTRKSRRTA